jgi:hypothetical protein
METLKMILEICSIPSAIMVFFSIFWAIFYSESYFRDLLSGEFEFMSIVAKIYAIFPIFSLLALFFLL